MKAGKRNKTIIISSLLILGLLAGFGSHKLMGLAMFEESQAVHINPKEIEDATLLIGTHLIYLGVFNDELYEIAIQSQEASGQYGIYYKSELAQGTWYEISSATSIADITGQQKAVNEEVIAQLFLTHHTRSDGITYDLRTNSSVGVYDIYPVYDLEFMEELSPIKNQYDLYQETTKKSATMKRNTNLVRKFFAMSVVTDQTELCDLQLQALDRYLKVLREHEASKDEVDAVSKVIRKVDAKRRVLVYQMLQTALEKLSDDVVSEKGLGKKEEFSPDAELNAAIGESQANVESSLTEQEGTMLSEGTTIMSREEYTLANRLITSALEGNHSDCDLHTANLVHLYHITEGEIVDANGELTLLEQELIPQAEQNYTQALAEGETAAYQKALAEQASHVVLESILAEHKDLLNSYRSELQFYIEARTARCAEEDLQTYVKERLENMAVLLKKIPQDNGLESAKSTVDQYIAWLQGLLSDQAQTNTDHALASLYEEKESLQSKRLQALDNEDLTAADKIDALITAKEQEINTLEAEISDKLQKLGEEKSSLEMERAQAERKGEDTRSLDGSIMAVENQLVVLNADLEEGSIVKNIQEEKETILNLLNQDLSAQGTEQITQKTEEMTQGIQALEATITVNSSLAGSALKEVYQKMAAKKYLEDTQQYDAWMEQIEEIIGEHAEEVEGILSGEEAVTRLEEVLGCSLPGSKESDSNQEQGANSEGGETGTEGNGETEDGAGGSEAVTEGNGEAEEGAGVTDQQATALLALSLYWQQNDSTQIHEVLKGLIQSMYREEDSYLFRDMSSSGNKYASAKAVAVYTGCRYLWNDNKKKAILASGKKYYGFYAFQKNVEREEEKQDTLLTETMFQSTVYIPESYLKEEFGCEIYSIADTGYAMLADEQQLQEAIRAAEALMQN